MDINTFGHNSFVHTKGLKERIEMTEQEKLLKVLDMSEDEQWVWCVKNPKFVGESLADLAFRLRDEAMNFNKGAWYEATEQVWKECHNYREYRNFWVDRSKPIHWIIAALIAKGSK